LKKAAQKLFHAEAGIFQRPRLRLKKVFLLLFLPEKEALPWLSDST